MIKATIPTIPDLYMETFTSSLYALLTHEPSSMIFFIEPILGALISEGMSEWTFSLSHALIIKETSE